MGFVWIAKASKKPKRKVRRKKVTVTYKRLEALGKQMGNATQVSLTKGITAFKRRVPKDVMLDAFLKGDYLAALHLIPWNKLPEDLRDTFDAIAGTVDQTAQYQIQKLPPNINENLRFDATNPAIRSYLHNRTGALITAVEDSTRDNVREIIDSSFRIAQTPRQLAERIKASVGLLPAHEKALFNYRAGLEANAIPADEVDRLAGAYETRLLDYRANMIARTETRNAINTGQLTVWREGVNQGFIERANARKEWVVDGDPCPVCEPMDGVMVGLDDAWIIEYDNGETKPVQVPSESHPHCMCGMELHFEAATEEETEE